MYVIFVVILFAVKQTTGNCNHEGKTCEWNLFAHKCRCQNLGLTCVPRVILECLNPISLHLQDNNITSINATDLFPYASRLQELILTNNQITSIALGSFQGTTQLGDLSLAGNLLPSLQDGVFNGLTRLTKLDLRSNKINLIENNVFHILEKLKNLDLSGNQLSALSSNIFLSLSELMELDLSNNLLTHIPAVFGAMPKLTTLILSDNMITVLPQKTISELTGLQVLHLDSNNISFIENSALANLINLQKLHLGKNSIKNLRPEILWADSSGMETSDLLALTLVDIYNNSLKEITKDFMQHLPATETLNLAGNQINFIEAASFSGMDNLRSLKLRQNELQYFDTDMFKDEDSISDETCGNTQILRHLEDFNLGENKLHSAPSADFFRMAPSLIFLEMKGNPLQCDCDILPMVSWFNTSKLGRSSKYDLGKCSTPSNLEGTQTATLNSSSVAGPCKKTSIENRHTLISASPGDKVTINCSTTGFPRPSICWEVPKHVNSVSLHVTKESIVIQKVSAQHEGIYVCHAANIFNNVSVTYKVVVNDDKSGSPVTVLPNDDITLTTTESLDSKNKTSSDHDTKANALHKFTIIVTILLLLTASVIIYMVCCHGKRTQLCQNRGTEQDVRNNRIARDRRRVYKTLVEDRDENIEILNLEP